MIQNIIYGIHTAVLKHVISRKESLQIKRLLGYGPEDAVSKDTSLFNYGINELSIRGLQKHYRSANDGRIIIKQIFELELVINFSKAIRDIIFPKAFEY